MLTKEKYIEVIKSTFDSPTKDILLEHIEHFYKDYSQDISYPKYRIGDMVRLPKDTYLHGFGDSIDVLDIFSEYGPINKDYEYGQTKHAIAYAVSLWHIKKSILLKDYIVNYSGMTVEYEDTYKMIPYGKLDAFVESMRKVPHFMWSAESSMEIRFMPSLAKDNNQLAFIINGRDKCTHSIFENNVLNEKKIPIDVALSFVHYKNADHIELFKQNRHLKQNARIAYIPFGIPKSFIEGILVGRKYEKNTKILSHIKSKYPQCYICNLDGVVIM